ncbi:putative major facilitator superfamily transporter [Gordonia namibiensis NBRC 108229]|uniref:Putative major facilitator superfamily transporter n=1 Tax=Gordonia namibiensis NBRC 108229 TaxID=1208314 RepID=K6X9F1_9ACTN|nr:MFS transporter [Gordonia namibiensis]GAC01018.1 putative major facilitator superfamily transporter [Gordonia namibiensis NBRC 108229]
MTQTDFEAKAIQRKARRAGIASYIGTTIEWYDFYIYGTAAALVFGDVFFPEDLAPGVGSLLAFVTLWAGFLARPLGGILFGHLGDRIGRKRTLIITLVLMGIATLGIGLLPTYAQVGVLAPILLVVLRVIQGVAVGGEWGGAVLVASENAPKGKGILYSAFAQQGSPTGNLLATLAFFALSAVPTPAFMSWAWRIPFLASVVLIGLGLFIRLRLEESNSMKAVIEQDKTVKLPIAEVLRKHWVLVLLGAGALPLVQVTYFKNTFALSWATSDLGYSRGSFLAMIAIALVVQFVVQPFGAVLVSKMDMRKAVALMVIPEFILMPAMFFAIETRNYAIATLGMCLATIPHSMFYGAIAGLLARAFPANIRYTGLSLAYQLCSLVVGGGTPVLAQWILNSTGGITWVAITGGIYAVVSLSCTLALLKRTGYTAGELSVAERSDENDLGPGIHVDATVAVAVRPSTSEFDVPPAPVGSTVGQSTPAGVGSASSDKRSTS